MDYQINREKFGPKCARKIFPVLVRLARCEERICYSDLAKEIGEPRNAINMRLPLGCIGETISRLNKERSSGAEIPYIQSLVINKETGLPGHGFDGFMEKVENLDDHDRDEAIKEEMKAVFQYPDWEKILEKLNLSQPKYPPLPKSERTHKPRGGGEGDLHKKLKKYVAKHPSILGLKTCLKVKTEYRLDSGDCVDVMFRLPKNKVVAVEVKSSISTQDDIYRGLFQCVKYQAVFEAMRLVRGRPRNVRTVLVLESELPEELIRFKNMLGVEVMENVGRDD